MKISLSTNQFFDDKGAPLSAGRITVFLHDSDTPCTVYTLAGEIYSEAVNPILTSEDGRIPTLFFDAAVVDVKVENEEGLEFTIVPPQTVELAEVVTHYNYNEG